MGNAEREREKFPGAGLFRAKQSGEIAARSWLLFEGIDTFLYDITRKSKITFGQSKSKSAHKDVGTSLFRARCPRRPKREHRPHASDNFASGSGRYKLL